MTEASALTIRQPWAWAIVAGHKLVENRSWRTRYRGPLYIHAGRLDSPQEREKCTAICTALGIEIPDVRTLPTHAIIATAQLVDVVNIENAETSPWASGPWCWILSNVQPITPVPMRGALKLWHPLNIDFSLP